MNLRSYVFNDDGIALVSERPIPDGSTALELSAFKNVYHKAISVIWILLDEQIQNQVRQSKSGPSFFGQNYRTVLPRYQLIAKLVEPVLRCIESL